MSDRDDFLATMIPRQIEAERELHNGDPGPRIGLWSRNDPVTLFGAYVSNTGWEDVRRTFERLASGFSDCESFEFEIVAAGTSGDLTYSVGYERTRASVDGVPRSYSLRVTHLYRREDGEWKIVHRHGDPEPTVDIPPAPEGL